MTKTRTDVHSPTNMDPTDYEFIGAFDNSMPWVLEGGDWALEISRKIHQDDRLDRSVWQCHHCGARIRYFAVMEHTPTGDYIVVGETCLDNRFSLVSKAEFDRLRKAAALDRAKQRIKTEAAEFVEALDDSDLRNALDRNTDLEDLPLTDYGRRVLNDMRNTLWNRYGSLTAKQTAFAARLVAEGPAKLEEANRIAAEREAEVKVPAPVGKATITGRVIKRADKWTDFGLVYKITIKAETPEGVWFGWVTEPSKIRTERGDLVTLTATWTRSDNDPSFAFGKRPSKAQILERPSEVPEEDALA